MLQAEEALLEREKRLLLAEALAVEQLMEGFSAAEGGINRIKNASEERLEVCKAAHFTTTTNVGCSDDAGFGERL